MVEIRIGSQPQHAGGIASHLYECDIEVAGEQIVEHVAHVHGHELHAAGRVAVAQFGREEERDHVRLGMHCREVRSVQDGQRELQERYSACRFRHFPQRLGQGVRLVGAASYEDPHAGFEQAGEGRGGNNLHGKAHLATEGWYVTP